jgi:hypothetical protein
MAFVRVGPKAASAKDIGKMGMERAPPNLEGQRSPHRKQITRKETRVIMARVVFQRGAEAGEAKAAMGLGATYDPAVPAKLGVLGNERGRRKAQSWWQVRQQRFREVVLKVSRRCPSVFHAAPFI